MPLSPSSNPLLADAEEDRHQILLEKGNLGRKPRFTDWHEPPKPITQWTATGYRVMLLRNTCKCGNSYDHLDGIFLIETAVNSNATKLTRLAPRGFQPVPTFPVQTDLSESHLELCPQCLPFNI